LLAAGINLLNLTQFSSLHTTTPTRTLTRRKEMQKEMKRKKKKQAEGCWAWISLSFFRCPKRRWQRFYSLL